MVLPDTDTRTKSIWQPFHDATCFLFNFVTKQPLPFEAFNSCFKTLELVQLHELQFVRQVLSSDCISLIDVVSILFVAIFHLHLVRLGFL